jgi:hypothetical protein
VSALLWTARQSARWTEQVSATEKAAGWDRRSES